jgi:hypothetical protein
MAINLSPWTLSQVEFDGESLIGRYWELFTDEIRDFVGGNQVIQLQPWGYQVWLK